MKLRKLLSLFMILPFLMSCNTSDISGTYGFQLGKDTGTHFGVFLDLTNNVFEPENVEEKGFKQFDLSLNVKIASGDEASTIESILAALTDETTGEASIPGYYKLTDQKNKKGESRLKVGFDFLTIVTRISSYFEKMYDKPLDIEAVTDELSILNNSSLIQSLLYVTHKDDYVYFYIPVSEADAFYQVYWYGYDIRVSPDDDPDSIIPFNIEIVEVTKHDFGSHPTQAEIDEINLTFADLHPYFSDDMAKFRDYNSVRTGLNKR